MPSYKDKYHFPELLIVSFCVFFLHNQTKMFFGLLMNTLLYYNVQDVYVCSSFSKRTRVICSTDRSHVLIKKQKFDIIFISNINIVNKELKGCAIIRIPRENASLFHII